MVKIVNLTIEVLSFLLFFYAIPNIGKTIYFISFLQHKQNEELNKIWLSTIQSCYPFHHPYLVSFQVKIRKTKSCFTYLTMEFTAFHACFFAYSTLIKSLESFGIWLLKKDKEPGNWKRRHWCYSLWLLWESRAHRDWNSALPIMVQLKSFSLCLSTGLPFPGQKRCTVSLFLIFFFIWSCC